MTKYICYPVKIESTGEIRLFNFVFDQSDIYIEDKILDDIYFKLEQEGDYTVLDLFYSDAETPEMVAEDYFATELRKHIQNFYFVGDEYIQQPDRNTISFEFEANLYTVKLKKVRYDFLEGRIQDYYYQVYSYQDGMKSKEIATDGLFTGFDFSIIDELVWGEFELVLPKFAEGGEVTASNIIDKLRNVTYIETGKTRIDKYYDPTDAEYNQRLVYKPIYIVDYYYAENTDAYNIGEYDDIDDALYDLNNTNPSLELDKYYEPYNELRFNVKEVWLDNNDNEIEEGDLVYDIYDLNKKFENEIIEYFGYHNTIEIKFFPKREESAEELESQVQLYLKKEYGREFGNYNTITLGYTDEDRENAVTMQIRVKDHSENPANKQKSSADAYLSIVIANKNETANRFHSSTELYFTGDNTIDEVNDAIFEYIEDAIFRFDVIYLDDKLIKAGHKVSFSDGGAIKDSYELTEENEWQFTHDLKEALGLNAVKNYHVIDGHTILRIKGHSPNWENFVNDLELNENIDRIINVTVGDYNRRRFDTGLKTKLDEIERRYPDIDFIDIEIEDGEELDICFAYIRHILYPETMFSLGGDVKFDEGGEVKEPTRAEKIKQKVEQHLIDAEKRRKVKDVGRVEMSRKQQAAYRIISMSNIDELNEDEVLAFNMVKKDAIWPPINVEEQKNQGVSAGAAYIKVKIREALPSKPANTSDLRKAYVNFLNILQTDLMELKTVKEVREKVLSYLNTSYVQTIEYFLLSDFDKYGRNDRNLLLNNFLSKYEIYSGEEDSWYRRRFSQNVIEKTLGKTFYNMISVGSEAAEANWKQAETYQQSEGDEQEYIEKVRKEQQKDFDRLRDLNKEIKLMSSDQFYKFISERYKNISRRIFMNVNGVGGEEYWRRKYEGWWNKAADKLNAEVEVPLIHRKRDDDWSWAIKKEKDEVQGEEDLKGRKINTKEPLAYIKRVNGYKTPDPTPQNVVDYYGFSAYNFGKYVPDNERAEHAKHFIGAITDLGEILNIDIKQVHQLGKLGFGVGLKGHAGHLAAYYSQTKDINLVRGKGDGSIAHEWGHFFDNLLCDLDMKVAEPNFASEGDRIINDDENEYLLTEKFRAFDRFVNKGLSGSVNYKKRKFNSYNGGDWTGKISILSSIDLSLQSFFAKYPSFEKWQLSRGDEKTRTKVLGWIVSKHGLDSYEIPLRTNTSNLFFDSSQIGSGYWVRKVELFARCFETYVFNKLAKAKMANNYLAHDNYFAEGTPYPKGEELDYITTLFDEIIIDFKKLHNIGDFKPVIDERIGEEIIELQPDTVMPKAKAELDEKAKRKRFLELEAEAEAEALALMEMEMEMDSEK